ncbi:MAG: hypothetical protein ACR2K5_04515 [Pseudolabrys sp.]
MVSVLLLAGCTGNDKSENLNVFPKNYKSQITLLLKNTLDDATNIRDAFITEPVLGNGGKGPYFACVRFNARDVNRQYKGSEDRIAYFYKGELNQLIPATPEQCARAPYVPFPEAQKLCMGKSCE